MSDTWNLQRFVAAQAHSYAQACAELRAGRKRTHWMWYVFPQLRGLGRSAMAQEFGISGLEEAQAYLAHPILGPRLCDATRLVNARAGQSLHDLFGSPDDLKFHSCVTLFAACKNTDKLFAEALNLHFDSKADSGTLRLLA